MVGEFGPLLKFTGTHLDQTRDSTVRLAQAQSLNRLLVREDGPPTILAGDMNARPGTDVIETFEAQWANASADPPPPILDRPGRPGIDYVFFPLTDSWKVIESRVIDETVASDHRPLLVVLEWTGKR